MRAAMREKGGELVGPAKVATVVGVTGGDDEAAEEGSR